MTDTYKTDIERENDVCVDIENEVRKPKLYSVSLLNDDYTTMEFVVHILMKYFYKSVEEAHQLMLQIHEKGSGEAGVFSFDIAQTKVEQVVTEAQENNFPLQCKLNEVIDD